MIYLRSVTLACERGAYPFNAPALSQWSGMRFTAPVTIIVGENGSGKSTFLEALARKLRLPAIGSADVAQDASLNAVQPLSDAMKTVFSARPKGGFFLRAEDFFGYTKRVALLQREMRAELARVEEEYRDRGVFAREQARMSFAGSLAELNAAHGENPDARSHGESFLHLFEERVHPGGLYLLDEPETPLSPTRQLALISMLRQREESAQFIFATHSPILMAYPEASIWSFDTTPASPAAYDELENVRLTRDFLACPARYLRHL